MGKHSYDYDFFVLGAGSGGVRASRIAATHGARVAVAEEGPLGGTCVNVGCVPKKLLAYGAHFSADFRDAAGYGWTVGQSTHDWKTLVANKNEEILRLNKAYRNLLTGAGVTILEGHATLVGPHEVKLGERTITADKILVATGGKPVVPERLRGLGITSNEAFFLPALPKRVLIGGGGYIAVEFAGIFHGLGAEVTLVHRGPLFLRGFDDDLRKGLDEEMRKTGVKNHFGATIDAIERTTTGLLAKLSDGTTLEVDAVLCAMGRAPRTEGLGLERLGVKLDHEGAIVVDAQYRTNVESVYAVGDVTNKMNLTPVALAEGHALADALFGPKERVVSYDNVPTAVFSHPPLATVGLTEEAARKQYAEVDIYRSTFTPMKATMSKSGEKMLMKLVVDRASDRVLGVHILGADGPEIIQGFAVALNAGATKAVFDRTIGVHPTAAEELVTMRTKSS